MSPLLHWGPVRAHPCPLSGLLAPLLCGHAWTWCKVLRDWKGTRKENPVILGQGVPGRRSSRERKQERIPRAELSKTETNHLRVMGSGQGFHLEIQLSLSLLMAGTRTKNWTAKEDLLILPLRTPIGQGQVVMGRDLFVLPSFSVEWRERWSSEGRGWLGAGIPFLSIFLLSFWGWWRRWGALSLLIVPSLLVPSIWIWAVHLQVGELGQMSANNLQWDLFWNSC